MPAAVVLVLFLGIQLFNGLLSLVDPAYGGSVGWWAHVGGFVTGGAMAALAPRSLRLPSGARSTQLLP